MRRLDDKSLPDLSVIIVNWNTRELLGQCLGSIADHWREVSVEVIVIDNASSDGSAELVESLFPWVILIRNDDNAGFVSANNQGARVARGRYLLLLNSDTKVLDAQITRLIAYMDEHVDVGAAAGMLLNADGTFQRSFRRFPRIVGAYIRHTMRLIVGFDTPFHRRFEMAGHKQDDMHEVDWLSGAYLLFRPVQGLGDPALDPDLFMYYEDTLLCYRIRSKAARIVYLPLAPVIHFGGASTRRVRAISTYNSFESSVIYFEKTAGPRVARAYREGVRITWRIIAVTLSAAGVLPVGRIRRKKAFFDELIDLAKRPRSNGHACLAHRL